VDLIKLLLTDLYKCRIIDSQSYGYGEFCLLECKAVYCVKNQPTFRRNMSPASFTLVFCLAYSSTLKTEATYSSETSVVFQRNTRRYIPENRTLQVYTKCRASSATCALSYLLLQHLRCGLGEWI
jgi:hypothetical protein